jgi:starch synthase
VPAPLAICLLASELEPLSKTGGLADVAGALTKYLHGAGHDVRAFTPLYASIDRAACDAQPLEGLTQVPLAVGPHSYVFALLRGVLPGGAPVYLIDCPALYARTSIYTSDPDEHVRFLALTRAALIACQRLQWAPQVIHCNDWHTACAPLFLRTSFEAEPLFAQTRTVLTIHNIGYQGIFAASQVVDVGIPGRQNLLHQDDLRAGSINSLRTGILYADLITTVSPTHAREICTDEYGMGLQDSLRMRAADGAVTGILNGVDYEEWDPARDRYLPIHYSAADTRGKGELKQELLGDQRLEAAAGTPLLGLVSRLAVQKGIELMFEALPKLLTEREFNFVALGNGESQYEEFFTTLARRFPGRVAFTCGYDEELAHWIEAASDMFLMPSRYEPCGLNQMYSLRYGTVPIVRRTGGLADSVELYDAARGTGTGILFNDFNAQALEWALNTALDLYGQPRHWARLMKNGMRRDFSWQRQGGLYVELYRRLTGA